MTVNQDIRKITLKRKMQSHRGRIYQSDDSLIQRRQSKNEAARSERTHISVLALGLVNVFYDRCLRGIFSIEMATEWLRQKHCTAALATSTASTKNYGCQPTRCSNAMYISVDIWASGPLSFGERCVVVEKQAAYPTQYSYW